MAGLGKADATLAAAETRPRQETAAIHARSLPRDNPGTGC